MAYHFWNTTDELMDGRSESCRPWQRRTERRWRHDWKSGGPPARSLARAVCDLALADERIVLLSADSGKSSGFGEFMKAAPERYFEFGIMEQAVIGAAAGLATTGKIPVFCAIAPFVTARPLRDVPKRPGLHGTKR